MASSSTSAGLVELHYDARLESTEVLYFTIRADNPKAGLIFDDMELRWRGRRFFVEELTRRRDVSGAGYIDVIAPALWNRLADTRIVGSLLLFGVTTAAGVEAIISASDWTALPAAGDVDAVTTFYLEAQDVTVLEALRQWAKVTGTELDFSTSTKEVRVRTTVGTTRGIPFRYGRNVTGIVRRSTAPRCTRLYAFGRNGLSIVGPAGGYPYIEDYSYYTGTLGLSLPTAQARYRRDLVYVDNAFTSDADLYAAAVTRLAELAAPTVSYSLDVIDLAELTHLAEDEFEIGDYVRVEDTELGFDVSARVTRLDRFPLEPHRGTVELEYGWRPFDPGVSDGRSSTSEEWVLLENRNEATARQIRNGLTIANRLDVTTIPDAEWIVGYSLVGVGVGTGSLSVSAIDTQTGELLHPTATVPIVAGELVHYGFTFGDTTLDARERSVLIRAISSGAGVGVDIAAGGTNLWVLAKGATERSVLLGTSQRFDGVTGGNKTTALVPAAHTFSVPADVTEVRITAVGGAGGRAFGSTRGGYPGLVRAQVSVTPGSTLYIYPGNRGASDSIGALNGEGGYPFGGNGGELSTDGGGGGGASIVTTTDASLAGALIVAAGGGGSGGADGGIKTSGGDGGYYAGTAGQTGATGSGGAGATSTAGGAGGIGTIPVDVGEAGDVDGQGEGGDVTYSPGPATGGVGSGGGGGGWHGGGAGGGQQAAGGGGSGYIAGASAYDLYTEDAVASQDVTPGYVLIEWDDPTPL